MDNRFRDMRHKEQAQEYEVHGVDFARGILWSITIYLAAISIALVITAVSMT